MPLVLSTEMIVAKILITLSCSSALKTSVRMIVTVTETAIVTAATEVIEATAVTVATKAIAVTVATKATAVTATATKVTAATVATKVTAVIAVMTTMIAKNMSSRSGGSPRSLAVEVKAKARTTDKILYMKKGATGGFRTLGATTGAIMASFSMRFWTGTVPAALTKTSSTST